MILNFFIFYDLLSFFIVAYYHNSLFIGLNTFWITTFDIFTRIQVNEFFLNLFYYLWTLFYFLPAYLYVIVTFLFLYSQHFFVQPLSVLIKIIFIWMWFNLKDYFSFNLHNYHLDLDTTLYNTLLTNSINKYHPLILYISTMFLWKTCYSLTGYRFLQNLQFIYAQILVNQDTCNLVSFLLVLITLFFGSWWAIQEGSWGGWWNWDPSEVFGLLILLLSLIFLHKKIDINAFSIIYGDFRLALLSIIFTYLFIQFNFNLTSHNFDLKNNQFINVTYTLSVGLIFSAYGLTLSVFTWLSLTKNNLLKLNNNLMYDYKFKNFYYVIFLIIIVGLEVIISFNTILTEFFWKIWNINVVNTSPNLILGLVYTSVLGLLPLWQFSPYVILVGIVNVLCTNLNTTYMLLGVILYFKPTPVLFVHYIFILFMFFNVFIFNKIILDWNLLGLNSYYLDNSILIDTGLPLLSLNSPFIEYSIFFLQNNNYSEIFWNFIWHSFTCEIHTFTHSIHTDLTGQFLVVGLIIFLFSIAVMDTSTVNLLNLLLLLIYYFKLKKLSVIVF